MVVISIDMLSYLILVPVCVVILSIQFNNNKYLYCVYQDRMWRKTRSFSHMTYNTRCRGVDPNRNFDFKWLGRCTVVLVKYLAVYKLCCVLHVSSCDCRLKIIELVCVYSEQLVLSSFASNVFFVISCYLDLAFYCRSTILAPLLTS